MHDPSHERKLTAIRDFIAFLKSRDLHLARVGKGENVDEGEDDCYYYDLLEYEEEDLLEAYRRHLFAREREVRAIR
jgi:hypothetical protein